MSKDVAQRDLDMAGFHVLNVGAPQTVNDATHVDSQTVPLPASGTGSPGSSLLAAPADHVHPPQPGSQAILQLESDDEMEVTGPTEEVVFQKLVDFGPLLSGNLTPVFSGFVGVDSGDTGTFNVRLGGTADAPDGAIIATITTRSATLEARIVNGTATPRPGAPALVKVTAASASAAATARIADLRITLAG